jgi:serine O-acetyltransferase
VHLSGRRGLLYYAWRLADLVYMRAVLGAELSPKARIGPGLALPHAGRGVVIADDAVIGSNAMIFWRVTIAADEHGAPRLGDDVSVATGAFIVGDITVGAGARIGANSLVLEDVPPKGVAFGVPARVLHLDE